MRLADNEAKLGPILRRVEKNRGNASLATVLKKDEARAKELHEAIQASQEQIAKLREELPAELELTKAAEEEGERRFLETVNAKLLEQRADLTLMPPGKGELSPGHLKVGDVGLLPQWPVVIVSGLKVKNGWPVSVENLPVDWRADFFKAVEAALSPGASLKRREILESHGGSSLAKKRDNLRVIQVVDEHLVLAELIGGSRFDWPTFIWYCKNTAGYGEGSTLRADSLVMVTKAIRYQSIAGVDRASFLVLPVDATDVPPYSAEPASEPTANAADQPAPTTNEATAPELDLDVLEVGQIGSLPQWPIGHGLLRIPRLPPADLLRVCAKQLNDRDPVDSPLVESAGYDWEHLKPYVDHFGGVGVARDQCNLRVVQVLDDSRIFVTFTGSEVPASWPLLVLDIGDTHGLADGTTLRVSEPVEVVAQERYTAFNRKSLTRFVLKAAETAPAMAGDRTEAPNGSQAPGEASPEGRDSSKELADLRAEADQCAAAVERLTKEHQSQEAKIKGLQKDLAQSTISAKKAAAKKSGDFSAAIEKKNLERQIKDAKEESQDTSLKLKQKKRELTSLRDRLRALEGGS